MNAFIGSSSESVIQANNLKIILDKLNIESTVWKNSFVPSTYTLECLLNNTKKFDTAFFIFAEDDTLITKDNNTPVTRDNVILETGLFVSALGRNNVVICTVGKPHIPTDLIGITRMSMEDLSSLEKQIILWLNNRPKEDHSSANTIEMFPRYIADTHPPLEERWKHAKEIWFVNYATTAFLAAQKAVSESMAKPTWYQIFEKTLQSGCNFKFLITEPNTFADFDASRYKMKTIPQKNIHTSALIGLAFKAFEKKYEMLKNKENYGSIECKTTDIALPYGLIMVINDEEHSNFNHIKVDLYSPELSNDSERRSFIIYRSENDNYRFFERQVFNIWNTGKEAKQSGILPRKIDNEEIEAAISIPKYYRQYFVGDLKDLQKINYIYDKKIECGISYYQKFTFDKPHSHTYVTEYLYVLQGEYKLAVKTDQGIQYENLTAGDFYMIPKLTPYASKAAPETRILFIKSPSLFDKVEYYGDDLKSFGDTWE